MPGAWTAGSDSMLMTQEDLIRHVSECRNLRIEQYDWLIKQGYTYDMLNDEFRKGKLIVPAWPPTRPDQPAKKGKK